jgi:protein SCO1/2
MVLWVFRSTLTLLLALSTSAGMLLPNRGWANMAPSGAVSSALPEQLKGVQIEDKLGSRVEIGSLQFRNEAGEQVSLESYFKKGKPVLLALVYYECPNLCTLVLTGLLDSLKSLDWTVGEKFEVVAVSINPNETPELATSKKANYLKQYARAGAESSWHFLTGEEPQIRALAGQVGFGYRYVPEEKQYAHGAAVFVLTPEGVLSRTLYGIQYAPKDVKLALLEASEGKIGSVVDRFLLFCYSYDPVTKKYSVTLTRVMQAGGLGSTLLFGGYLAVFWFRQRRVKDSEKGSDKASAV